MRFRLALGGLLLLPAIAAAEPSLRTLQPSAVTAGAPGFTLSVSGQGFTFATRILWDGGALPTRFENETLLTADVPASRLTRPGTVAITVTRTDQQASDALPLTVNPALEWITSATLPSAAINQLYSQALGTSGGTMPVRFALVSGTIPPGLHLDGYNGTLVGYASQFGQFDLTLRATDASGASVTQSFRLAVSSELRILTDTLPPAVLSQAYTAQLAADGGTQPVLEWKITAGTLPKGLALDEKTGRIAGTATGTPAVSQFTVRVRDSAGKFVTRQLAIELRAPLTITLPSGLGDYVEGDTVNLKASAGGGLAPYAWSVASGELPAGLYLDSPSGAITGTLAKTGAYRAVLQVRDASGTEARAPLEMAVAAGLALSGSPVASGIVGTALTYTLTASGGSAPYTWSIVNGVVPDGLRFSAGRLDGQPRAAGESVLTVEVRDRAQRFARVDVRVAVTPPPLPALQLAPLPALRPAQQTKLDLRLDRAYPTDLQLIVGLNFEGPPDPAILLSTGGREARITIPAGQLAPLQAIQIQTGTTAGTLTVEAKLASQSAVQVANIDPLPPQISSVKIEKTTGGFAIVVSAFSPTRELETALFSFDDSIQIKVPLRDLTATWYADEKSTPFGTQFTYRQNFTAAGDISRLRGVSVSLGNRVGTSAPVSAAFY